MANPFARSSNPPANFQAMSNPQFSNQNAQKDPVDYAAEMLTRSGGNAQAAFYLACKEKGIDAESFLQQVRMMKSPQAEFQNMLLNNPKAKSLMTLFSLVK